MLLLKKIDVYGQAFATILCLCLPIFSGEIYMLMSFYFVIGSWQIISVLLHLAFANKRPIMQQRQQFHRILLIISILFGVCCINGALLMLFLFVLLLVSPFSAIWYFSINHKELSNWEAKELVHFR